MRQHLTISPSLFVRNLAWRLASEHGAWLVVGRPCGWPRNGAYHCQRGAARAKGRDLPGLFALNSDPNVTALSLRSLNLAFAQRPSFY
jgi:hypothetical protein